MVGAAVIRHSDQGRASLCYHSQDAIVPSMVLLKQIKIVLSHGGANGSGVGSPSMCVHFPSLPSTLLLEVLQDEFRLVSKGLA